MEEVTVTAHYSVGLGGQSDAYELLILRIRAYAGSRSRNDHRGESPVERDYG